MERGWGEATLNPLTKTTLTGDWLICYSAKQNYGKNEVLQAFTKIGQVADGKYISIK